MPLAFTQKDFLVLLDVFTGHCRSQCEQVFTWPCIVFLSNGKKGYGAMYSSVFEIFKKKK